MLMVSRFLSYVCFICVTLMDSKSVDNIESEIMRMLNFDKSIRFFQVYHQDQRTNL